MGVKLPFGFPLDYPETGGRYEQMAHEENARFGLAKPSPRSPEWAQHRERMAKLNALDAWAVAIGNLRRRRNHLLLLAIFFGRQLRTPQRWRECLNPNDRYDFRDLATAAQWRDPKPRTFDRQAFRKAVEEADRVWTEHAKWKAEEQANQNEIDTMLQQIMRTARGERWLNR